MKMNLKSTITVLLTLLLFAVPAFSEGGKKSKSESQSVSERSDQEAEDQRAGLKWESEGDRPQQILKEAMDVDRELKKTSKGGVPDSVKSKAECIAIVPDTVTAAAGVGGSHGDGVAVCKSQGEWSNPAFVDLDAASLGAQLGMKNSDIVLYFTSNKAADALKRGSITFGADANVVAGNFERSFDVAMGDIVAYQNTSGAFAGASISGGRLVADDDSNRAFYGREMTARDILSKKADKNDKRVQDLVSQITK